MPEPIKLFISYRSSDAPKVDKIARDLALLKQDDGKTQRYIPWQDKHNLPPATPHWWDAIVDALADCQVFVFHISKDSLKSVVCQAELDYAHKRNRPIIPIVLDGEFLLNDQSGKYDLPKETWALIPTWFGERQFLFYTGADFFRQFEMAMDVFRRAWPRDVYAPRPFDPSPSSDQTAPHTLYDQACDYAERLAFAEAEKRFDVLLRRNDLRYGAASAEWLELLRRYAELIEVDALPRARFTFKPLWEEYIALFPKTFWEGLFDPKGLASKIGVSPRSAKRMTAEEYLERAKSRPTGDYDLRIADYTEAIRLNPNLAEAYSRRAGNYNYKRDYDRAIADANEAIRLNPQYASAYYNRGNTYAEKGNHDRAIADYTETIRFDPQHIAAYMKRGNSYKAKSDYDRAIADYTQAIRLNPLYGSAYYNRGNIYAEKGNHDRAIADYTETIRFDPQHVNAYLKRGNSYKAKSDYDRAIADYTQAIRLNPLYAIVYVNRASSYYAKNDHDRAIADYSQAIRLDSQDAYAYYNRGLSYYAKGDYDHAIDDYTKAIRLNPLDAYAYNNRGLSYYAKGDHDRAIADYTQAIHLNPQYASAYNRRGLAYYARNNFERANDDYTEAIRFNPQYPDAYINRGNLHHDIRKDYDQAIADYDMALQIDPRHELATNNRKRALESKKRQRRS
jgi:tetratricopeptide (TPR) repeat protein